MASDSLAEAPLQAIPARLSGRELIARWQRKESLWWDEAIQEARWGAHAPDYTRPHLLVTTSDYQDADGRKIWEGGGWTDETFFYYARGLTNNVSACREAPGSGPSARPRFIPC